MVDAHSPAVSFPTWIQWIRWPWLPKLPAATPPFRPTVAWHRCARALKTYRFNNETKGIEWEFYGNILMLEIQLGMCMSDCENPRFTERTSTNLGRSHRLPHVCTIMIYCKLGGYRFQETAAFIYTYIYVMNYE